MIDNIDLSKIADADLFACTDTAGITKSVTGAQFKELFVESPPPWEGHDGGIWHIKNVQNDPLEPNDGPFTAWDIDGANEREITEVAVGEELVFVTGPDCETLYAGNWTQNWEFGEFTDVSKVTIMSYMFYQCSTFNSDISNWDTSNVTKMDGLFAVAQLFNSNIGSWDTSNVTDMESMFRNAEAFNQPIGNWNTSNVTTMNSMFLNTPFNQDIGDWNTSNVERMSDMFRRAAVFNTDISRWDTSKVFTMSAMFREAAAFNQDLSGWCVSLIPSIQQGFDYLSGFEDQTDRQPCWGHCPRGENGTVDPCPGLPWEGHNGGIFHIKNVQNGSLSLTGGLFTAWDIDGTNERKITSVAVGEELVFVTGTFCVDLFKNNTTQTWEFGDLTDISKLSWVSGMFNNSRAFNSDISNWNMSNVENMASMFLNARAFNGDISNWDTSKVGNMAKAFQNASVFNGDISNWNTGNVVNMGYMFQDTSVFNGDVSNWNTSNVVNMAYVFYGAEVFNADIGGWDVSNVTRMQRMFWNAPAFNQDIDNWDTSKVTDMTAMFLNATVFNRDLSGWCVSLISSKPTSFDSNSGFEGQDAKQPQWGTCP